MKILKKKTGHKFKFTENKPSQGTGKYLPGQIFFDRYIYVMSKTEVGGVEPGSVLVEINDFLIEEMNQELRRLNKPRIRISRTDDENKKLQWIKNHFLNVLTQDQKNTFFENYKPRNIKGERQKNLKIWMLKQDYPEKDWLGRFLLLWRI